MRMEDSRPRLSIKSFFVYVCLPLCLLILLLVGTALIYLKRDQNLALEQARKLGFPTTAEELDASYPPISGNNAADVYAKVFAALNMADDMEAMPTNLAETDPLPEDVKTTLKRILAANASALDLLHQAGAIKDCRYLSSLSVMPGVQLRFGYIRQSSRLLAYETVSAADAGDSQAAVDSIVANLALYNSLRDELLLISQLVRFSLTPMSVTSMEIALQRVPFSTGQLSLLSETIAACEEADILARCLPAEFYFQLQSGAGATQAPLMADLSEALKKPFPESFAIMEQMLKRYEQFPFRWTRPWGQLLIPNLFRSAVAEARTVALIRAAKAALAVQRFRQEKGHIPSSLAELVPEYLSAVPEDPFSGRPLQLQIEEERLTVSSIGSYGRTGDHPVRFTLPLR